MNKSCKALGILKAIIVFTILIVTTNCTLGQDKIFLKDFKDTIYCQIIKDNINEILYFKYPVTDSTILSIKGNEIEGYSLAKSNLTDAELNKFGVQSNKLVYQNAFATTPPLCIYYSLEDFQKDNFDKLDSGFYLNHRIYALDSLNNVEPLNWRVYGGRRGSNYFIWKNKEPQWFEIHGWFSFYTIRIVQRTNVMIVAIPLMPAPVIVPIIYMSGDGTDIKNAKFKKMIFDCQTGKSFKLNIANIYRRVLKYDEELLNRFIKEDKVDENVLKEYLKLFNERNKPPYLQDKTDKHEN